MERKQEKKQAKGAPAWMVTFSDMITLVLVFFILLFAMSSIDAKKFNALAESFQQRSIFEFYPSPIPFDNPSDDLENNKDKDKEPNKGTEDTENDEDLKLNKLYEEVKDFIEKNEIEDMISAIRDDRGVVLTLQERPLFKSGEAEILDGAKMFLSKVGSLLETIPNIVKVEGHTDSVPINSFRYPSNWELSGARASSVIRYILENNPNLDPYRFIGIAYGETRPAAPNTTPENLQKNRRVVIVISDPNYNEAEEY